jgi:hypothetical protein
MDPRWVVEAFIEIWHELPRLFRSAWKDAFPRLEEILLSLQASTAEPQRNALVHRLAREIHPFPAVRDRLREILDLHRYERSGQESDALPDWADLGEGIDGCLDPPAVSRHVVIEVPNPLPVGSVKTLVIEIRARPEDSVNIGTFMYVRPQQLVEVHLQGTPGKLEILSPALQQTLIEPDHDSDPLRFEVRGLSPGEASFRIDFRQSGVFLMSLEAPVEIHQGIPQAGAGQAAVHAELKTGGRYRLPADLDFRIFLWKENDRVALSYELHSATGIAEPFHTPFDGPAFKRSEEDVQRELLGDLQQLHVESTDDQRVGGLKKFGHNLYDHLFPQPMRDAYRLFRGKVETLQIISDEPWIPWELIKPYDGDEPEDHHDFLGAQFICARWLSQSTGPAGTIGVSRLACVAVGDHPGRKRLAYPARDREVLRRLALQAGIEDSSPEAINLARIESLMTDGEVDLWHISAPGEFYPEQPAVSRFFMPDGNGFSVRDLDLSLQSKIAKKCPLVFFNVAQGAQQGWGLTRLDGWAWAWVVGARCGAFVAPLSTVTDSLAHLFAASFYEGLLENLTVGQAMAKARIRVRKEAPEDPSWIAYCLYGNPNARVIWRTREPRLASTATSTA